MHNTLKYRHEYKLHISLTDYYVLLSRLPLIMSKDSHADENNSYKIRSLYFDNVYDKALMEKINGDNRREKFRIRYYNNDLSFIKLEKKCKINGLCLKLSCPITKSECEMILNGDTDWMKNSERQLLQELKSKMTAELLNPRTVITYDRNPFIYEYGNVRVTLDKNIRTSMYNSLDFFDIDSHNIPVINDSIILEIKYDEFLPEIIRNTVFLNGRSRSSYSKYECGRCWG